MLSEPSTQIFIRLFIASNSCNALIPYNETFYVKKGTIYMNNDIKVIVENPPTKEHIEKKLKELGEFLSKELSHNSRKSAIDSDVTST